MKEVLEVNKRAVSFLLIALLAMAVLLLSAIPGSAAGQQRSPGQGTGMSLGGNSYGQLGDNTTTQRNAPVQVLGPGGSGNLTGMVALAAGGYHSLALKSDGTVWAWGMNVFGELGDNTTTERDTPVQVLGPEGSGYLTGVVAIAAGHAHCLALKSDPLITALITDPHRRDLALAARSGSEADMRRRVNQGWGIRMMTHLAPPITHASLKAMWSDPRIVKTWPQDIRCRQPCSSVCRSSRPRARLRLRR